jgi:formylglycine-generating enzyme required for sulfatase activity
MTELAVIQQADERAIARLVRFEQKYGGETLELARLAAFAMTLTTDLVRCLRENFVPDAPWYGVADVLLGGLCEPIGYDLYEMNGADRRVLLGEVSPDRLAALAAFMRAYVGARLALEGTDRAKVLGDRPEWTALPYLYGEAAAWEQIRAALAALVRDADRRERLHIMALVESYAQSLLPTMAQPILQWVEDFESGGAQTEAEALAAALGVTFGPVTFEMAQVWIGTVPEVIDPMAKRTFEYETVQLNRQGQIVQRERRETWGYVEPVGDLGLEMIAIPGGEFEMGSPEDELGRWNNEGPMHRVTVPPFFMGQSVVTQALWRVVAGWKPIQKQLASDPSRFKGDNLPVTNISWHDVTEFCVRLSRETGRDYRLPSEAMWEYACRAGTQTAFNFGPMISPDVANYAWDEAYDGVKFKQKDFEGTLPVGHFPANPWGLYEMHGNVWEWCADHWHEDYDGAPINGIPWIEEEVESTADRVIRCGSWFRNPRYCRSASRNNNFGRLDVNPGFRVICFPRVARSNS